MNATNLTIAAVTSVFGEHRPLVRGTRAEDAYYSANSCDWLAAVIHALTRAAAALPRLTVTTAPVRAKLA